MIIDNNNKMIKISHLSSMDAVALYEFQVGKASNEQKQNGHSTRNDQPSRTTCEAILHVHIHGPAIVASCNSKKQG